MPATYLNMRMAAHTEDALMRVIDSPIFQTADVIAGLANKSRQCTEQKLRRLYHRGRVERIQQPLDGGGFRFAWRKIPGSYIAPLFDAQPGVDGRALDECLVECFGGMSTYVKSTQEKHA